MYFIICHGTIFYKLNSNKNFVLPVFYNPFGRDRWISYIMVTVTRVVLPEGPKDIKKAVSPGANCMYIYAVEKT